MLERIAIYSKDNNSKTREGVNKLVNEFCRRGIKILIYQKSEDPIICPGGELVERFSDMSAISGLPDLVLSVGGDGTFLETVLKVKDLGIPIAGVNTGRMGSICYVTGNMK
jgi:NAD+ kinase